MVDDLFEHQLYDWNYDKINNVQLEADCHGIRGITCRELYHVTDPL